MPSSRQKRALVSSESSQLLEPHSDVDDEDSAEGPQDLLKTMPSSPISAKERRNEMDARIVRECIREYAKGGMYFSYGFGDYTYLIDEDYRLNNNFT